MLNHRYLVGRVLGQGGFGITYIGFDTSLETKVAIKEYFCMNQTTRDNTVSNNIRWSSYVSTAIDGKEAFLKEARKMAKIRTVSGVSHILDIINENETAYLVMEYVEGETLANCIIRLQRPLTWEEARPIFMPVIRAMHDVHQYGLIHRDLSPDNLMLDQHGHVTILDMGAAKDIETNHGVSSMVVAKSGFSPIEQYGDRGGTDPRTDIYALCATMYYALTGIVPPPATDRLDSDGLDLAVLSQNSVPPEVISAITAGCAIFKTARPESMEALAEMFRDNGGGKPAHKTGTVSAPVKQATVTVPKREIKTAPPPVAQQSAQNASNKKLVGLLIGLCAVLLLLIGSLVAMGLANGDDEETETNSDTQPNHIVTPSYTPEIGGRETEAKERIEETVFLDQESLSLFVGDEVSILAVVSPQQTVLSWHTDDATIATVSEGTITAVSEGRTNITVSTPYGVTAVCAVTVSKRVVEVEGVSLNKTTLTLTEGESSTVTATVSPADATEQTVTWKSSNPAVATVTDGKITAVAPGKAAITATAGGKAASCRVTVEPTFIPVSGIALSRKTLAMTEGDQATITAKISPEDATEQTVTWKSSNTAIATVSGGKITATAPGTVTITATAGDCSAACAVTVAARRIEVTGVSLNVTTASLRAGEATTLTATISPANATDRTVTWKSSNTGIATVSNGKITAVSPGTATITATAGGISYSCQVTVLGSCVLNNKMIRESGYYDIEEITKVTFLNTLKDAPANAWDYSEKKDRSVLAWLNGTELYIGAYGNVIAGTDMSEMFAGFKGVTGIDLSGMDTSNVTDMNNLFHYLTKLVYVDLSSFDTSQVTNMREMFWWCCSLTSLDVSGFDTSKVTDMYGMFLQCDNLTSLDLSSFNTSRVNTMAKMFYSSNNLVSLNLSSFDTSSVTDMEFMFYECYDLTDLDVSGFDTSKVTDMSSMFSDCRGLTSLDVSGFNTSKVTDMSGMFASCSQVKSLDVSGFDTSNVIDMSGMFSGCAQIKELDVSNFNTSKVTLTRTMFKGCSSLTSLDVSSFDTSNVTITSRMFADCTNLTKLNTKHFDMRNVSNSIGMFENTKWDGKDYAS